MAKKKFYNYLQLFVPILLAIIAYSYFAYEFNFYQDDAYISYRFIQNYLNGDGLVFNVGEFVEGYTNFGWVIFLSFWGVLGVNFILVSKITGFICGLLIIVISYILARLLFGEDNFLLNTAVTLFVGINQSLAYWSPAGLETSAFALMTVLAIYLFLKRSYMLIPVSMLLVLIRPDGALVVGILFVLDLFRERKLPVYMLQITAVAFLLSLPFVIFKLVYYGSILPNPFYAKTSFDLQQLSNGFEYIWRFLTHYGFYGVPLVLPLLFWRKLSENQKLIYLFALFYTGYILFVGGDVLKVHRFFIPVITAYAVLSVISLDVLIRFIKANTRKMAFIVIIIPLMVISVTLPRSFVTNYNFQEKAFIRKMSFVAKELKKWDNSDFKVALATIGVFGYELVGHDIIDMLGLTDSTIAKYSDEPIEGMESTWKEGKHNSKYLLSIAPDYIMFSTGLKPSAPAEKALMLYPQFLKSYRAIGRYYENKEISQSGVLAISFKKMRPVEGEIIPTFPLKWVDQYKLGLEAYVRGDHNRAIQHYSESIRTLNASQKPFYPELLYQIAYSYLQLKDDKRGEEMLNITLETDSLSFNAHKEFYIAYGISGNTQRANLHRRWLMELVPWYVPRLDNIIQQALIRMNRNR